MNVRFVCTLYWRVADIGMLLLSTWPSSITSPVRTSFAAFATSGGFWRFIAPFSSPAPHLDGHRCDGSGTVHVGCCAEAAEAARKMQASTKRGRFMAYPLLVELST